MPQQTLKTQQIKLAFFLASNVLEPFFQKWVRLRTTHFRTLVRMAKPYNFITHPYNVLQQKAITCISVPTNAFFTLIS